MSNSATNVLLKFFSGHLDRIYCGKEHLVNSLPALADQAQFSDLKLAILELRDDVRKQMARMNEIYGLLQLKHTEAGCVGMIALLQEMFEGIDTHKGEKPYCDLSLMFYLQNIESIETTSFQMLRITAAKLEHEGVNQLLRESFDEAKEDRGLLLQISQKFMALKGLTLTK
jgi:ferritin-like metal-binding protein YciE